MLTPEQRAQRVDDRLMEETENFKDVDFARMRELIVEEINEAVQERESKAAIADDQVRTAIAVLKAYVAGSFATDLCDELDEAIEAAFNAQMGDDRDDDYETPLTQSW